MQGRNTKLYMYVSIAIEGK